MPACVDESGLAPWLSAGVGTLSDGQAGRVCEVAHPVRGAAETSVVLAGSSLLLSRESSTSAFRAKQKCASSGSGPSDDGSRLILCEHKELHCEIGVLMIGAHECMNLTSRQPLNGVDELRLHRVLPVLSGRTHLVPPAVIEQRLLAGRIYTPPYDDHELGLDIRAAFCWSLAVVLLVEANHGV